MAVIPTLPPGKIESITELNNLRGEVNNLRSEVNDLRSTIIGLRNEVTKKIEEDDESPYGGVVDFHVRRKKVQIDEVNFSLIIPTRERIHQIEKCLHSFFNKASKRLKNEAILVVDNCDPSMRNFGDYITQNRLDIKMITVWRSEMMIRDYNNYGAQCSTGKYLWILNDDCEMVTDNWDMILKQKIEDFCSNNGDRCCYTIIDDSTHTGRHESHGCCFPILTRESVEAMNGIMPQEISYWGADVALHKIFKALPENRILDTSGNVKILHHSRHSNSTAPDHINKRIEDLCTTKKKCGIDNYQEEEYTDMLRTILHHQPSRKRKKAYTQ